MLVYNSLCRKLQDFLNQVILVNHHLVFDSLVNFISRYTYRHVRLEILILFVIFFLTLDASRFSRYYFRQALYGNMAHLVLTFTNLLHLL